MFNFSFKRLFLRTIGKWIPSDWFAYRLPVSVKGICFIDGKVILLKNERDEWDLPGGKLERREEVEVALQREMLEEVGIEAAVHQVLDAFRTRIRGQINVLLVVYLCTTEARPEELMMSQESFALKLFSVEELVELPMAHQNLLTLIRAAQTKVPA